jgi:hypothetical protein
MLLEIENRGSRWAIGVPEEEFRMVMQEEGVLFALAHMYGKYLGINISDFGSVEITEEGASLAATDDDMSQLRRFRLSAIGI